jgi:hypothetical protein
MLADLAYGRVDVDALCLADPPDAIFLPHRNYRALNTALVDGSCLLGFVRVVEQGSSPLYVRADHLDRWNAVK